MRRCDICGIPMSGRDEIHVATGTSTGKTRDGEIWIDACEICVSLGDRIVADMAKPYIIHAIRRSIINLSKDDFAIVGADRDSHVSLMKSRFTDKRTTEVVDCTCEQERLKMKEQPVPTKYEVVTPPGQDKKEEGL